MKVNWKTDEKQSSLLFARRAALTGLKIYHWRVGAGEMPEQVSSKHELHVTLSGNMTTERQTATGKLRNLHASPGKVCLTPAGQPMSAEWKNDFECLSINFEPALLIQTALGINISPNFELIETYQKNDPLIQHVALNLLSEFDSEIPAGKLYAESLSQTLVLHILRNYTTARFTPGNFNGGLSGYKLRRATKFIHENIEGDLTLTEIAGVAGLSQFHFARAFRRTTGLTPQQYITQKRIERAKLLLADGDLPLVEVSLRAGFKNQSHFTTLFRKFTRLTPKAWRELKHA
ncbi:MAG TPA: AraC family transcriptional regulator [Pyrinomonadaceae bacterium]